MSALGASGVGASSRAKPFGVLTPTAAMSQDQMMFFASGQHSPHSQTDMEVMQSNVDERQEGKADTTLRVVGFSVEIEMGVPDRGPVHQRPEVPLVELVDPATSVADSPQPDCSSVPSKCSYSSDRVEGEREQTIQDREHI